MIEQTERSPGTEPVKATKHAEEPSDPSFEQIKRIIAQAEQPVGRRRAPKAVRQLNTAKRALLVRSVKALAREIYQFDASEIQELIAESDPRLLVTLVQGTLSDSPIDRTERMMLKGAERLHALLVKFGGTVTTKWVGDFFGASEDAIRKRVQRKALLARRSGSGELSFPRFQFDEATGDLVPGLPALLLHVKSWPAEEIVRFLLVRHNPSVSQENPLDLLKRGDLAPVIELADMHLTQRP